MRQTILAVVIEARPEALSLARTAVERVQAASVKLAEITTLHFLSMTVFDDPQFDPLIVIEANIDGSPGYFWPALVDRIGPELLGIVRFAKAGDKQALPVVAAELPAFLERNSVFPAASHRGNRGLSRARIEAEAVTYARARALIEAPAGPQNRSPLLDLRRGSAATLHRLLSVALAADLPPTPELRIEAAENLSDWKPVIALGAALALAIAAALMGWDLWKWLLGSLAVVAALAVPFLVFLRHLERTDPTQDAPPIDAMLDRRMRERETGRIQNHLASMVHVKPGMVRAIMLRIGLWGLQYYVRLTARDGYLASMRSIHFAHWSLVQNGSRILFFSNYDGSWESYLDDFVEKAHVGLTLAWSNCVGFPRTRWLVRDGATHGREFKLWARHSQRESLVWFTAYPGLTVNQIERHARVVEGLRRPSLDDKEAARWALDL